MGAPTTILRFRRCRCMVQCAASMDLAVKHKIQNVIRPQRKASASDMQPPVSLLLMYTRCTPVMQVEVMSTAVHRHWKCMTHS